MASLAGRLMTGLLLDRFSGPRVSFVLLVGVAAGIQLLSTAHTTVPVIAASVLIGLGLGGEADITPYLLTRYFGLRSFSTLYGFTWTAYAIAGAIGRMIMGRVFDLTGSYTMLLSLLASAGLLSAILMLSLPPYGRAPREATLAASVVT
jgi:MFS family permease